LPERMKSSFLNKMLPILAVTATLSSTTLNSKRRILN
jgi:hypothetical protein